MRKRLIDLLSCPSCGANLNLSAKHTTDQEHIVEGSLACCKCIGVFQIVRGVPRFAETKNVAEDKAETAKNFGWQWNEFTQQDTRYEAQFLGWLQPVRPEFFNQKIVLDAGCGKGRHTLLAHKWGAQEVVGVDLSDSVDSAFDATKHLPNVHIVQGDIFALPLKRAFDYAFSVGVLHHTPDPKKAFHSVASKVKQGGALSAWVYGEENNGWITGLVNPIRERVTSKMKPSLLYHFSKLPTFAVFAASKALYKPVNRLFPNVAKLLFYNEYLNHISTFGWREQHNIVFDHLVAPTAFYIGHEEFVDWWNETNATDVEITWHNKNSWTGFGRVQAP